ncbi:MAG: ABC transporter substrate-binding protein [Lentisphaeria bacterium]|jgi:ABC-type Fe3+ transport system substrate-binding protein
MSRSVAFLLLLLGVLLLAPVLVRERVARLPGGVARVVVITPHNEAIRHEFGRAFAAWHRRTYGQEVVVDWRTPGGTSDIIRYLTAAYTGAFRQEWRRQGGAWDEGVPAALFDRKLRAGSAPPAQWAARQAFLGSGVSSGIDLFFGGGQYDHQRLAEMGILVPCGLRERQPGLFAGEAPLIPRAIGGESWYDEGDRYYGVCLTAFGICYNPRRWREAAPGLPPPTGWADLGAPALAGRLGIGDPAKSGSVAKAFEMLVQEQMARAVAAEGGAATPAALAAGWEEALLLVRRIGANARYFTHSAGKVPLDVAAGDAVAGMCIDFYGRFQAEWENRAAGEEVLRYFTPAGGSSYSADPVALLRGAPNGELARRFIDFLFTAEGQRLWNRRAGAPGGPERYALRRLPIRRDLYTAAERRQMSDSAEDPFAQAAQFTYHGEWTGPHFNLLRLLVRAMVIDTHEELVRAWAAITAAGGPAAVPAAMAEFRRLPFGYAGAAAANRELAGNRDAIRLARTWAAFFRARYRRAAELAQAGR